MSKQLSIKEYHELSKLAEQNPAKVVGGAIYKSSVLISYCMKCGGRLTNYGGSLYFCQSCGNVQKGTRK